MPSTSTNLRYLVDNSSPSPWFTDTIVVLSAPPSYQSLMYQPSFTPQSTNTNDMPLLRRRAMVTLCNKIFNLWLVDHLLSLWLSDTQRYVRYDIQYISIEFSSASNHLILPCYRGTSSQFMNGLWRRYILFIIGGVRWWGTSLGCYIHFGITSYNNAKWEGNELVV